MLCLLFKMLFPNAVRRIKRNNVIFLGIAINRVAKTVKGGRVMKFAALVVV